MIDWGAAALLLLATGGVAQPAPMLFAQLIVREQIVVRRPVKVRQLTPTYTTPIEWKESKGPKCIPARSVAGAALLGQTSVDLVLRDNRRLRAKLEKSCAALDYYRGFYISPSADGQICADRDSIRSRMGGECEIERFRLLKAKAKR